MSSNDTVNANMDPNDADDDQWEIPPPPPVDTFKASFNKGHDVAVVEEESGPQYTTYRSNPPATIYSMCSWLPESQHYPPAIQSATDDVTLSVMDFLCEALRQVPQEHASCIEIEGRLGLFLNNNARIRIPSTSEAILFNDTKNKNHLHRKFAAEVYPQDLEVIMQFIKRHADSKTKFIGEQRLSDETYSDGTRLRRYEKQTEDGKQLIEEVTRKQTLATVDVFNPRYKYDYRFQVNVEVPMDRVPNNEMVQMQRRSKRFMCQHYNIRYDFSDIEQTAILPQGNRHRQLASAEIEALNPKDTFYKHFQMREAGQPSRMLELTTGLVNHLREIGQLFPNEQFGSKQ